MIPVHDGPESNRGRDSEVRVMGKGNQDHSSHFFQGPRRTNWRQEARKGVSAAGKVLGASASDLCKALQIGLWKLLLWGFKKKIRISISKMFALGRLEDGSRLGGSFSHLLPESNWN